MSLESVLAGLALSALPDVIAAVRHVAAAPAAAQPDLARRMLSAVASGTATDVALDAELAARRNREPGQP